MTLTKLLKTTGSGSWQNWGYIKEKPCENCVKFTQKPRVNLFRVWIPVKHLGSDIKRALGTNLGGKFYSVNKMCEIVFNTFSWNWKIHVKENVKQILIIRRVMSPCEKSSVKDKVPLWAKKNCRQFFCLKKTINWNCHWHCLGSKKPREIACDGFLTGYKKNNILYILWKRIQFSKEHHVNNPVSDKITKNL